MGRPAGQSAGFSPERRERGRRREGEGREVQRERQGEGGSDVRDAGPGGVGAEPSVSCRFLHWLNPDKVQEKQSAGQAPQTVQAGEGEAGSEVPETRSRQQ